MNLKKMSGTRFFLILASILCSATSANAQLVERPLISGRHAVVTSDEPLASMAGMRILQEGGNAFDAAVAIAAAVGVLDPRMSSIGGNGFATVYVGKTQEVRARSTSMDPRQSEPAASGRCCVSVRANTRLTD
jgi:gamma-glutamyltranspeptidase